MIYRSTAMCVLLAACLTCSHAPAQNFQQPAPTTRSTDTAAARMRPIGSPSAVDQYRQPVRYQETAFNQRGNQYARNSAQQNLAAVGDRQVPKRQFPVRQFPMRQVAMLQSEGFTSPPLNGDLVPGDASPTGQPSLPRQPLPANPNPSPAPNTSMPSASVAPILSPSDLNRMPAPNLSSGFATIDNCNCVSPASGYSAASGIGCGSNLGFVSPTSNVAPITPGYAPQNYGFAAPQAQIPGPAVMPVNPGLANGGFATGNLATGTARVPRALISFGQQNNPVQVGQGLWGQPIAYVPGQFVRNWVRYFFP